MIFVVFLFSFLFVLYFFLIWLRWLSILPIWFLLFVIFNLSEDIEEHKKSIDWKKFLIENIFFIARCLILIWIYLILYHFQLTQYSFQILLWINILFFLSSYLINYQEGKKIFQFWLYFTEIWLILTYIKNFGFYKFVKLIEYLSILNFWIYTFVVFIIWIFKKISNSTKWNWFLLLNIVILFLIYNIANKNSYYAIFYTQIYLLILFAILLLIKKFYNKIQKAEEKKEENILQKILKWEKVFTKKKRIDLKKELIIYSHKFIEDLPNYIKFSLGLLNLVLIFIQIYFFVKQINTESLKLKLTLEIWYWWAIAIFFINFLLLKYLNFYYQIQRIFFFFIINFWIYLTIIDIFWKNIKLITIIWIIWNIANSIAIFLLKKPLLNKILFIEDFYLWIIANIWALIVNLFFILKLNLDYQLKIWIISIYLWTQLFLTFYNFKFLTKWK